MLARSGRPRAGPRCHLSLPSPSPSPFSSLLSVRARFNRPVRAFAAKGSKHAKSAPIPSMAVPELSAKPTAPQHQSAIDSLPTQSAEEVEQEKSAAAQLRVRCSLLVVYFAETWHSQCSKLVCKMCNMVSFPPASVPSISCIALWSLTHGGWCPGHCIAIGALTLYLHSHGTNATEASFRSSRVVPSSKSSSTTCTLMLLACGATRRSALRCRVRCFSHSSLSLCTALTWSVLSSILPYHLRLA